MRTILSLVQIHIAILASWNVSNQKQKSKCPDCNVSFDREILVVHNKKLDQMIHVVFERFGAGKLATLEARISDGKLQKEQELPKNYDFLQDQKDQEN